MSDQLKAVLVLLGAILVAVAFYLFTSSVTEGDSTLIQSRIKLASAVIGFTVSVYGGVKALVELTKPTIDLASVQGASLTGVTGAILLLASQV